MSVLERVDTKPWGARLEAYYAKYALHDKAKRQPSVAAVLRACRGREAAYFAKLVAKYGPEGDAMSGDCGIPRVVVHAAIESILHQRRDMYSAWCSPDLSSGYLAACPGGQTVIQWSTDADGPDPPKPDSDSSPYASGITPATTTLESTPEASPMAEQSLVETVPHRRRSRAQQLDVLEVTANLLIALRYFTKLRWHAATRQREVCACAWEHRNLSILVMRYYSQWHKFIVLAFDK
jgi:hypothetical protein